MYRFLLEKTAKKATKNIQNVPVANGIGWFFGGSTVFWEIPYFFTATLAVWLRPSVSAIRSR